MSNILCVKCGRTADSKCPSCRSIFGDDQIIDGVNIALIDTIMSYRMTITDKSIAFKLWPDEDVVALLTSLRDVLKKVSDEGMKILACSHEWEFAPFSHSEIGCGHGSEYPNLKKYMEDMWIYVLEHYGDDVVKIVDDAMQVAVK